MAQHTAEGTPANALTAEGAERLASLIDSRLEEVFPNLQQAPRLDCAIRHALLSPGKRFRPLITMIACAQSGGAPKDALDAACAVEMVHAASLVMDDLPSMDNARLRRGGLATHVVFGEGVAMLATVSLLNEAYRLIANAKCVPAERRLRALDRLCLAIGPAGLAGGQDRDIGCLGETEGMSLNDMEQRHFEKTGSLFAAAACIGGECAAADDAVLANLNAYGAALGLAYQAFDDVLDKCAKPESTGKDAAQDADKATVVNLLGEEGARRSAKRWLDRACEAAEAASAVTPSPLAALANRVGEKFKSVAG